MAKRCPFCQTSNRVRGDANSGVKERFLSLFLVRAYRCYGCGLSFSGFSWDKPAVDPPADSIPLRRVSEEPKDLRHLKERLRQSEENLKNPGDADEDSS